MSLKCEHSGGCSIHRAGSALCDCGALRKAVSEKRSEEGGPELWEAWARHNRAADFACRFTGGKCEWHDPDGDGMWECQCSRKTFMLEDLVGINFCPRCGKQAIVVDARRYERWPKWED
jgi:hypothetical protein